MKQFISNKKGEVGKEWIFALAFLFALTFLYLIFNMVYSVHLSPIILDALPEDANGAAAQDGILFYMSLFKYAPYILFGVIIIYMFLLAVKKEPIERSW